MATDRSRVSELPPTVRFDCDPNLQVLPGSGPNPVLLGGSPYTMLTVKPAAAALVDQLSAGSSLSEAASEAAVSLRAAMALARRLLATGMLEPCFEAPHRLTPDDVSAVIPALNEAEAIGPLVDSLRKTGVRSIIVVDDGSTDATTHHARSAGAVVLSTVGHTGPGAARNAGTAVVTTPLVLFIDADAQPVGDWLNPLLAQFDDLAVAAVAPRVRSAAAPGWLARYETVRSPLDLGSRRGAVRPRSRVSYVPSAAVLADTSAVRAAGCFDASLLTGEDVDLVWRLHAAGRVVRYEPSSTVEHRPRPTLRQMIRQRVGYGRSAAVLDERHPWTVAPISASGWSVAAWTLAALGGPVGVAAGATTALSTAALLESKLGSLAAPRKVAWRLALRGHWGVGKLLAGAVWRAWLPLFLIASIWSKRARSIVLVSLILPGTTDWAQTPRPLDLARYLALRAVDDAAYCSGVWQGCLRARRFRALLPHLANWPGPSHKGRVD